MLLDKNSILTAVDLKRETVPVPEWGKDAEVIVQEMSALDRDRLWKDLRVKGAEGEESDKLSTENLAAKVLVRCIVNQDGARLFVDEEAEPLGRKSQAALARIFEVAKRLNGLFLDQGATAKK